MQSRLGHVLYRDPAALADLLKVRAARLALRWEMGGRPMTTPRPPLGPTPGPPRSEPPSPEQEPAA